MRAVSISALAFFVACSDPSTSADVGVVSSSDASTNDDASGPDAAALIFPALRRSDPRDGARAVPRSAWLRLDFDGPVSDPPLALNCAGAPVAATFFALTSSTVIVNPSPELPAGARCTLAFTGGESILTVDTATAGPEVRVLYDRRDKRRLSPFPDDLFRAAGGALDIPIPAELADRELALYQALIDRTALLDGFSPIAHAVVELSSTASVASFPRDGSDPLGSIGLFDIDPASATYAQRVPFRIDARDEESVSGATSHSLLVFPGIPLEPRRTYALVITRRALSTRYSPLSADASLMRAMAPAQPGEAPEIAPLRSVIAPALTAVEEHAQPPIPREDIALVLRFTVRSVDRVPDDVLAMRARLATLTLPPLTVTSTEADGDGTGPIALIVRGQFSTPSWRESGDGDNLSRNGDGSLATTATVGRDFVLALPRRATPAPIIIFQHGNPGSSETTISVARESLATAGFAVIGFTDVLNREVSPGAADPAVAGQRQVLATLQALLRNHRLPEYWLDTTGQQLALIQTLRAPGPIAELDHTAPLLYYGVSEGAVRGSALVPYAPEIHAAALTVGGARLVETLIHQAGPRFVLELGALLPNLSAAEIWVGLSLFQTLFDDQDGHVHARFFARQTISTSMTMRPTLLVTEGLGDHFIPNSATDSLAWQLDLSQLAPAARRVPFLPLVNGPLRTSAFFQFVPGVTPGCEEQLEGHYCPQNSSAAVAQRLRFFTTALSGVPEIISP